MDIKKEGGGPSELLISLIKRVEDLEKVSEKREKEISRMSTDIALTNLKTEQLKDILQEIKDSIKEIAAKINTIESKPGQRWDDIIKTVIVVCVTAFVTWIIKK